MWRAEWQTEKRIWEGWGPLRQNMSSIISGLYVAKQVYNKYQNISTTCMPSSSSYIDYIA